MIIEHAKKEHFAEITAVWEDSVRVTHHFLTGVDIEALRPQIRDEFLRTHGL